MYSTTTTGSFIRLRPWHCVQPQLRRQTGDRYGCSGGSWSSLAHSLKWGGWRASTQQVDDCGSREQTSVDGRSGKQLSSPKHLLFSLLASPTELHRIASQRIAPSWALSFAYPVIVDYRFFCHLFNCFHAPTLASRQRVTCQSQLSIATVRRTAFVDSPVAPSVKKQLAPASPACQTSTNHQILFCAVRPVD